MKYIINRYPKNKDEDQRALSPEMKFIRAQNRVGYGEKAVCKRCRKEQPINEFYIKNKQKGRRDTTCRDCRLTMAGVVEVGKTRFAKDIFKKHFRRCSVCKDIKPLTEYPNNKHQYGGYANNCNQCAYLKLKNLQEKAISEVTDWYVREYGKRNYGLRKFDAELISNLRAEILGKRAPKYFLDGMGFVTVSDFARYVKEQYGNPITMTESRIAAGKTEIECILPESEMRSNAYTKGIVIVTDIVTGEVFEFKNTKDKRLVKMFSGSAVDRCIKTGGLTRVTKISKHKNPCKIERVLNNKSVLV